MEAICPLLDDFIHGLTPRLPEHPSLVTAVRSQLDIGIQLLPRGFISMKWTLDNFRVEHPERMFSKILRMIWFEFTDALWRNRIAHLEVSRTRHHGQETWESKLQWYLDNPHEFHHRISSL